MKKNNKSVQIFLGIALLGIWGTIIYRVVDAMKGDEPIIFSKNDFPIDTTSKKIKEAFKLRMDYGDPFLGQPMTRQSVAFNDEMNSGNNNASISESPPATQLPVKPKKKVVFPQITYQGMVKNNSTGTKIALLKILSQSRRIKNGEDFNGVRVLQIERDSVRIYFKGEMRTFRKQ